MYQLHTVTYGTASASYLAMGCLHYLEDEKFQRYARESQFIRNDICCDQIEDRNFCIVYLKNRTITVFYLHVRQNVVFRRSSRTRVFLEFVCSAFPRIVFALAFWET